MRAGRAVHEVAWWPAEALPPLGFDHGAIVQAARDLRRVHEMLTGRAYVHETNFWRQMTTRWGLQATGRFTRGRGRPAALYRLPERQPIPSAPEVRA